ncbi:MAG: hypothetical protein PHO75_00250 [Candidatus Shapirobacteria bacterium]|jgi:hypothetical protein|nr:hypothetical protein [Candidatus Shapirobacteria bacterium]
MVTKKKEKNRVNPFIAAITGAVIGAGVAIASVISFKDKKNRDKVKKVFIDVKDKTETYLKQAENKVKKKRKAKKIIK